jgi:hypothetical protein
LKRALAAAALLGALAAAPGEARVLWSGGEASLEFSGSARQLLAGTGGTDQDDFAQAVEANPAQCLLADNFPDCPAFLLVNETGVVTSLTRVRGRLDLRITPRLSAALAYDHELRAGTLDTFEAQLGRAIDTQQWAPLDWTITESDSFSWDHLFYRLYLDYESEHVGVTLGRQRIPWGVGRLWNPIDRFNAIGPLALEADQSGGVDAVNARWRFSGFTYLQGVYAAAEDSDNQSYAARLHGVFRDVDYSLVVGVFEKALTVGFDLDGNLGDAAARVEVVWTHSDREIRPIGSAVASELGNFWQVVISVDYFFDVGTGLYGLVEHLYNGNALGFGRGLAGPLLPFFEETDVPPDPAIPPDLGPFVQFTSNARFGGSRVVTRSANLTGVMLGYDFTPEIRGELLAIYDWTGTSVSFFPIVRYDALDWLQLTLGAQFFAGPRLSEFGDLEPLGYLLAEFFF